VPYSGGFAEYTGMWLQDGLFKLVNKDKMRGEGHEQIYTKRVRG
jgi:hypothetical protein